MATNGIRKRRIVAPEGGIASAVASTSVRLAAVQEAMREHYGRTDHNSRANLSAAARDLGWLLEQVPPGMAYLTMSAKEGVMMLSGRPPESVDDSLQYVIKRVPSEQNAHFVARLSDWIGEQRRLVEQTSGHSYLQMPAAKWPTKINGYSVVFFPALEGEDGQAIFPKVRQMIKGNSSEAKIFFRYWMQSGFNNVSFWQAKASGMDEHYVGAGRESEVIRDFVTSAFIGSAKTLEAVTERHLTGQEWVSLREGAEGLSNLLSSRYAFGLDSGPKNLFVTKKKGQEIGQLIEMVKSNAAEASYQQEGEEAALQLDPTVVERIVWQVDTPLEMRIVHPARDLARLGFAPATELSVQEALQYALSAELRTAYFKGESSDNKNWLVQQIRRLDKEGLGSLDKAGIDVVQGSQDVLVSAMAEAARAHYIIPQIFMSRNRAMSLGVVPSSYSRIELANHMRELRGDNVAWALKAIDALDYLVDRIGVPARDVRGIRVLEKRWAEAKIIDQNLPKYKAFSSV